MSIYFDNAATTPLHPEVIKTMMDVLENVQGNPSSIHQAGRKARTVIENARKIVANYLNCSIGEVFFTSSATEANNSILRKAVENLNIEECICSRIEHPCVLNTLKEMEANGSIDLQLLDVDRQGIIDFEQLKRYLHSNTKRKLVSIMHVNNELGTIQDIENIGILCKENNALFHTDAVQSIAKLPFDLQKLNIDFLSASAHKFHGPKGIGFMYIKNDHKISPFITGGGQERNMRSGTENISGIAGLAKAIQKYSEDREKKIEKILSLKERFKNELMTHLKGISFVEDKDPGSSIATILSVLFPHNPKTELMTFNLDIEGIAASAGSACSSGVEQASHVLEAINLPDDKRAVRFSFSYLNTEEEVDLAIQKIVKILS